MLHVIATLGYMTIYILARVRSYNDQLSSLLLHVLNILGPESVFNIAEFFDLENAALEYHRAENGPSDPRSGTRTPDLTLRSMGSKSPVQPHIEITDAGYNDPVLHAYGINKYPKPVQTVPTSNYLLPHWPIEHYVSKIPPSVSPFQSYLI
jgi:hypothetical protein